MVKVTNKARRHFTPLDLSYSVVCASGNSPFMQTTDGVNYFPDRTKDGNACVAYPLINATTKDGSWNSKQSNIYLANMVWYVFILEGDKWVWKDITTIAAWSGKYEIDTSTTTSRGSLQIKRNLASNEKQQLRFEADLVDYRTRSLLHIYADPITLNTVDKGGDMYGVGIGEATNVSYNPFLDKLALYDYQVANNLIEPSEEARNACFDGEQYIRTIPIDVYKGKDRITSGYSLELYRLEDNGTRTELNASTNASPNEVIAFALESITLDMRLIEKNNYMIQLLVDDNVVSQFQFSAARFYPPISQPHFTNQCDIDWGLVARSNKVVFSFVGNVVEYPARIIDITWFTTAVSSQGVEGAVKQWNDGETCQYNIEETGIGDSEKDWIDESVEYSQRKAFDIACDDEGDVLVDSDNEPFII